MDKNKTTDTNKISRDTDEERENTEEIEDKKRERKKEEKVPIKIADSKPSSAAAIATDICFLLLILLAYIVMMAISGGSVYAAYGWRGRGSNGTFINSVTGMIGVAVENLSPTSRQMNPTSIASSCPTAPTCPPVGGCIPRTDDCIPQLPPACIPQPIPPRETCLDQLPCRNGSCCPPYCPTPTPEPSIEYFRTARLDSKTGFEWLNMFPPYSPKRLEVVTHLLDTFIEPWAVAGFFHRCTNSPGLDDRDTTICSFCNDRYDYIKCIMSNTLVRPVFQESNSFYYTNSDYFKLLAEKFANAIYDRDTETTELDSVFDHIEGLIKPYAVRPEHGEDCRVCTDFSRTIFNRCISHSKKHYVHPKDRGQ